VVVRLISELKRRNVLRMAVLYAVAAWLVMQVAEVLIGLADLPAWLGPAILAVLAVGFPIALIISWFYELTPEGLALDKDVSPMDVAAHAGSRRADVIVIAMLAAAVILFAYDKWWPEEPLENSIAVLPFENLSGDPEQEYFSDGISEEILNLLAQIEPLKVIARTSSFSFKDKDVDIATVAARLNVSHVLEGSVRRSGDQLRIAAQLIDATDSTQVWSQTYDLGPGDVFVIQDEIAAAISDSLKVQLELAEGEPVLPHVFRAANAGAYDAYLKGRDLFRNRGRDNIEAAIREFERALRLDENFAPAHAQLAIATAFLGIQGTLSMERVTRIAVPHLERADRLAPNLAEVHAGWALLADLEGDYEAEVEHAKRALEINPVYGDALNSMYIALIFLGRYDEQDEVMERSHSVDPADHVVRFNYAEWLWEKGRREEARAIADQLLSDDARYGHWAHADLSLWFAGEYADGLYHALQIPNHFWAGAALGKIGLYAESARLAPAESAWLVDANQGNWEAAAREIQEPPDNVDELLIAGLPLYRVGRIDEALLFFERAFERAPEGRPIPSLNFGPMPTIWLAEVRRQTGDEHGAQLAAEIARRDIAAQRANGRDYSELRVEEAMLAAFDNDLDGVIRSLRKAIDLGLRDMTFHWNTSSFSRFREEPRFVAVVADLEQLVAAERNDVLQLICFNNPAPDEWQPMPETCAGLDRQGEN
jgi:TolB-like protein/Tfp pilus assembly protein PilF